MIKSEKSEQNTPDNIMHLSPFLYKHTYLRIERFLKLSQCQVGFK